MARSLTGVEQEFGELATQTVVYSSVVDQESRTMAGRLRAVREAADRMGDSLASRFSRVAAGLSGMNLHGEQLGALGGRIGGIALSFGKVAAAIGAAVPVAGGLVGLVAQMAPAAGVAVTAFLALQLATKAFKLGMVGVGDAVKAAMDPSDPAAFEEALKKLAPSAQAFAREVRTLQPAFKDLQQGVQQRMFNGLDVVLRDMGKSTLPILKQQLNEAGTSLNFMAKGVGESAIELSKNGTLGRALSGANEGLANLTQVPGQFVTALTQVGAASISQKITKAFESGAMERAIDQAIVVIKQLGEVAGNVFRIIGSIFSAAQASGGGMIGVLQQITRSLATAFASPAVQEGLRAIFTTMATLASTVGPLLVMALQAIAPVFTALGPPIQRLIGMLGKALEPIIKALGPVLEAAAVAVGALLDAISPLLPVIGSLIGQLLPALTPLLTLIAGIFKALAPMVAQFAQILMSALSPILAALIPVIQPIVDALMVLVEAVFPILSAQAAAFAPIIAQVAAMFAELLVALAPVIAQLIVLVAQVLSQLTPALTMVIGFVSRLAGIFANELGTVIRTVVVPAFQMISALLSGDFRGAWEAAKRMVSGIIDTWIRTFRDLPARAFEALGGLGSALWSRMQEAGGRLVSSARQKLDEAIAWIRGLGGRARDALGDLGGLLWNAGSRLISGFIDGIRSAFGRVRSTLSTLTGMLPDWKGPAAVDAKILRPAGRLLMQGFQRGIQDETPSLQQQLGGLTGALPGMALAGAGGMTASTGPGRLIVEVTGPDEVKSFIRRIVQVDGRGSVQTAFG
jgi:phage-related protein